MKIASKLTLLAVAAAALPAGSAGAATLFDSQGFEAPAYSLGNLNGQNGWTTDGSGLATVQNSVVKSGAQAVAVSGNVTDWHYPFLGYAPSPGEIVRVSSDIQRGSSAAPAKNFGFFLDAYTSSIVRFARAGLGVSGGSPALLATYTGGSGVATYIVESGLAWDTWYNIQMDFDFTAKTYDLYLDGALKGDNLPFVSSTAADLGDVDLQQSYTTGATDVGYFDNYVVMTVIPEPTSASLLLLGVAGLMLHRRRQ
jgi:hypothetical protein